MDYISNYSQYHSPTNCFDILVESAVLRIFLVLVGLQEDHGLLVAIGADLELLLGHLGAGYVLEVLVLELALVAQVPDELVGAVVELVELIPLLQVHAPPGVALDAAHPLPQFTGRRKKIYVKSLQILRGNCEGDWDSRSADQIDFWGPLTDKVCPGPPSWQDQSKTPTLNAAYQVVRRTC